MWICTFRHINKKSQIKPTIRDLCVRIEDEQKKKKHCILYGLTSSRWPVQQQTEYREIIKYACTISFFLSMMCKYAHRTEMKTAGLAHFTISSWLLAGKGTTWILSSANAKKKKGACIFTSFHCVFCLSFTVQPHCTVLCKKKPLVRRTNKQKKKNKNWKKRRKERIL